MQDLGYPPANPTSLTTDLRGRIAALYSIEADVRGQPFDVRNAGRQDRSVALVDAPRAVIEDALLRLSPKSDVAKVIGYGVKLWPALVRFQGHGRLNIDNNIAERAIRGIAVKRRNWLFAGAGGGKRAAVICTSSRPARPTASTRKPATPMSPPGSLATGPHRADTN